MSRVAKPVIDVTGAIQHYSDVIDTLNYFLKDIRKYNQLTAEQETELFRRIKAGDDTAVNELMEANQLFVLAVAKRYSGHSDMMDLVQVGNIGMLQAIKRFNPNRKGPDGKNVRFLSFAVWYIKREISFYVINNGLIRRTNNVKTVFKLNKIKNSYFLENGRYPSTDELREIIEEEYGIKIKDNTHLYDIDTKYLNSAYDTSNDKDTFERSALYNEKSASYNEYDEVTDNDYKKEIVANLLGEATERERDIIKRLFGIGYDREYTVDEVSSIYGMTRERIRQLKNNGLKRMKRASKIVLAQARI